MSRYETSALLSRFFRVITNRRKVLLPLVAAVLCLSAVYVYRYGSSAGASCRRGSEFEAQSLYANAIAEYRKATEQDPGLAQAWVGLGRSYARRGMNDRATEAFKKGTAHNQQSAELWYNLGKIYTVSSRFEDAAAALEKSLSLGQGRINADAHFVLAYSLAELGKTDKAIAEYRAGIALDSTAVQPRLFLAILHMNKKQFSEAEEQYRRVRILRPDDYRATNGLGAALAGKGEVGQAIEMFRHATTLQAADPDPWFNLGLAYERQGLADQAIESYQKTLSINEDYLSAHKNLAMLYYKKGDLKRAKEELVAYQKGRRKEKMLEATESITEQLRQSIAQRTKQ